MKNLSSIIFRVLELASSVGVHAVIKSVKSAVSVVLSLLDLKAVKAVKKLLKNCKAGMCNDLFHNCFSCRKGKKGGYQQVG